MANVLEDIRTVPNAENLSTGELYWAMFPNHPLVRTYFSYVTSRSGIDAEAVAKMRNSALELHSKLVAGTLSEEEAADSVNFLQSEAERFFSELANAAARYDLTQTEDSERISEETEADAALKILY
jgi:hypothetical protein